MAETRTDRQTDRGQTDRGTTQQQGERSIARRQQQQQMPRRWESAAMAGSPFEIMDRLSEEMDRLFERMTRSAFGRPGGARGLFGGSRREGGWLPRIETSQRGDTFVVCADLPGLRKEDVDVELTDDAITIRGERRQERQEEQEGHFRSEREYGQFHRTIPLPEGVIAESAKATFKDGVLEISMQAAPESANRGRRIEIQDGASTAAGDERKP